MYKYLPLLLLVLMASACDKELTTTEQLIIDKQIIRDYLADNNIQADSLTNGLYYVVDEPGIGTLTPSSFSTVIVSYKGYFLNGDVFDENLNSQFNLGSVIAGWRWGIPQFKKDEKGRLFIPSGLGYGRNGQGSIPANSVLIFDIHLKDFN